MIDINHGGVNYFVFGFWTRNSLLISFSRGKGRASATNPEHQGHHGDKTWRSKLVHRRDGWSRTLIASWRQNLAQLARTQARSLRRRKLWHECMQFKVISNLCVCNCGSFWIAIGAKTSTRTTNILENWFPNCTHINYTRIMLRELMRNFCV